LKTLKVLSLLFAIVASFGCQPALYGNLRNDILSHNLPSLQVDLPIADPVTLELKEGITNRITGDCDVTVILSDKSMNELNLVGQSLSKTMLFELQKQSTFAYVSN